MRETNLSDSLRQEAIGLTHRFFNDVATRPYDDQMRNVTTFTVLISDLNRKETNCMGVVMDEIGYLAGTTQPELGVVSQAFRIIGDRAREAFLATHDPKAKNQLQDSSNVMLLMANMALPHNPLGGVNPQYAAPLFRSLEALRDDTTKEHISSLCSTVLLMLNPRAQSYQLTKNLSESDLNSKRNPTIEARALLFKDLAQSGTAAITTLTLNKAASPKL